MKHNEVNFLFTMRVLLIFIAMFLSLRQGYSQDWLANSVPPDLDQMCLIVEKIDSAGMKCRKGRTYYYCNSFDKETDSKLTTLQKQQEQLFRDYKNEYIMVLPKAFPYQEYADLKDLNKYRYILRMNTVEASDGSDYTYHWVYYFHDRLRNEDYPRIKKVYDQRLRSLKEIVDALNAKAKK